MNLRIFLTGLILVTLSCKSQRIIYPKAYSNYKVFTSLKKALKNKDDVEILHLTKKDLKVFPSEILQFKNLKVLNLTDNHIKEIPSEIGKLKELEWLQMMKNELKGLPPEIVQLKKLKRINVAFNYMYDEDVEFIKQELPDCLIITQFTD
ncbi:hypothetical protein LVD17_14650 [Fulvivirga ulvae]|uniref:leucine-rich repeat domain-containing protein n=1 Tax=Fulvivirga ulvae TaxID=2904245 RepID=UPI001F34B77C|nr:hypothetical protein [Fulvivirga ulvae]UII35047.1 hypothetical protein LVD17_14650 [Fulvivirga ulvae]